MPFGIRILKLGGIQKLVLSCVLRTSGETSTNFENEPNTRLDLCSVLSPNDESEAADQVMTEPTHLKGEHCEVRHGSNAPDSLVFGNPPKGNVFGEQVLNPLLQSLGQSIGDEYWLLDSGASCCVVNQTTLENFQHDDLVSCGATFTAANGTPVPFVGKCNVVLKVQTVDSKGNQKPVIFKVPVMVGNTPYNILSTLTLGKLGLQTVLTDGVSIDHVRNGLTLTDTMIWCETPCLKVKPYLGTRFRCRLV